MKRLVAAILLCAASGVIWLYLWWGRFQYQHAVLLAATYATVLLLVLAGHFYYRDTARCLGLRFDNFRAAARWYGAIILIGCGSAALAGKLWGSFRLDRWYDIYVYALWSVLQQYGLQNFLRVRSRDLLISKSKVESRRSKVSNLAGERLLNQFSAGSDAALNRRESALQLLPPVLLASGLFALYHLPNMRLVLFSFAGALIWCFSYARVPNFFWAWLSQALITGVLLLFFKYNLLGQFQIGYAGHRYQGYGSGVQVSAGYGAGGEPLIVTVSSPDKDTPSLIRVFDIFGQRRSEWIAYENFKFSANIAVGDLGFGPGDEVAVAPGPAASNPAMVRIFNLSGNLLKEFHAWQVTGGYGASLSIQCGTILLSPGPGPYSRLQIFEFTPEGKLNNQWNFPSLDLRNGLRAAALCVPSKGLSLERRMIIVFWATPLATNPSSLFLFDPATQSLRSWPTFSTTYGLNAVPVRLGQGKRGVAVAPGDFQGYPAQIQVYDNQGRKLRDFLAYQDRFSCGSHIAAVDINGDGEDELVLGEGTGPSRPSTVRILRLDGKLLQQWNAYP
jgi:hypothetical protein